MARQINSRIEGLYRLTPAERRQRLADGLHPQAFDTSAVAGGVLGEERADKMIENVVGIYELPFGIATNFTINGHDYLVPMVVEEPSIVA
ncbi:MAG: hypothetical protein RI979_1897, partial [Pseudomonadota bacterium]